VTAPVVSPPLVADDRSLIERFVADLADLAPAERAAALDARMAELEPRDAAFLLSWEGRRRPSQTIDPTGDTLLVAFLGGRGAGKTLAVSEAICDRIEADMLHHGAFVSRTPGDVRRVMIEGEESGFMACAERRGIRADHQPSLAQIKIIDGGTITLYSAQEPDSLRGPQHDTLAGDEFGAWPQKRDAMGNTAFTNAMAGLRLGEHPLGIFATTPKAIPEVKDILTDTTGLWRAVRMTTWGNAANLAPGFIQTLHLMYGGTRLAAQEFDGIFLEDSPGALWSTLALEASRVHLERGKDWRSVLDDRLVRRWVACDPSVAADGGGDECGIVAGGVGLDRRLYILSDISGHLPPRDWAARAIGLYYDIGAECIVAEGNQGGALVSEVLHGIDPSVPVEIVHAKNSKRARAEPIAALWQAEPGEEPLASIVGSLPELEAELTTWDAATSGVSPNRLDAMCWLGHRALRHLYEPSASWSSASPPRRLPV
jgi:phage terminase large subunit-like protein